jgi:hypothetical protein
MNTSTAPQPSGQSSRKMTRKISLVNVCEQTRDNYDRITLQQATNEYQVHEVLTRKRNQELEHKNAGQQLENDAQKRIIAEQAEELQKTWVEKDKILDELETTKHDLTELGKTNYKLNQSLNYQMGNSTTMFADETQELNFQHHERSSLAQMRETIHIQEGKINLGEEFKAWMKAEHEKQKQESQAMIHALQLERDELAQQLEESDQAITEKMRLNKTISEEKAKFENLNEEYQEKVQDNELLITKIEGQQVLQQLEYEEKMECLRADISKRSDRLSYWKQQADKKSEEVNVLSKILNNERASSSRLCRKVSMKNEMLTRKNRKIEAERKDLQRELLNSRMEFRDYAEKKKLSSTQKLIAKCLCVL